MNKNKKTKIYIRISGGLGNQMFEYATARAVQLEQKEKGFDSKLYFTYEYYKTPQAHEKYKLNLLNISDEPIYDNSKKSFKFLVATFFFHIYLRIISRFKNSSYEKFQKSIEWTGCYINTNGYYKIDSNKKNICLKGFFQDPRYFNKYKNIIIDELSIKSKVKNQKLYNEILKNESVCIHVRRGDYVNSPLEVCTKEYYLKAIKLLKKKYKNLKFYVFSDDIKWCKENIIDDDVTYVEGNSAIDDLKLMYSCKYYIISNSTFSWWSQYLSKRVTCVIAPNRWSNDRRYAYSELYNDNDWILIDF